jgi:D-glycero-alpha-D-manno-heptose-7-phosphate kinase
MIVTRTPFRITLGGGGTDLPSFYREHGGFVLAVAINKYMFLSVNTPILDDLVRVRYSKAEQVQHVSQIEHTLARMALEHFGIENGIEVVSIADIPAGTGLGSSSCYLVGLLNALHTLMQTPASPKEIAEEACNIELNLLKKPIGKQDQYMAAYGGLMMLDIAQNGKVHPEYLSISPDIIEELENSILLFYTGAARDATSILTAQDQASKRHETGVIGSLTEIKDIGIEIASTILAGNLHHFGELMDYHWQVKKRLSVGITNPTIDAWYELAKHNGAVGGKITGAGGGGFLMVYCEDGKAQVREALRNAGLRELTFRFEFEGSKVVFDIVSRDGRLAHMRRQMLSGKTNGNGHVKVMAGAAAD